MSNSTLDKLLIISHTYIVAHSSVIMSGFDSHILYLPSFVDIRGMDIQPGRADIGADCSSQRAMD